MGISRPLSLYAGRQRSAGSPMQVFARPAAAGVLVYVLWFAMAAQSKVLDRIAVVVDRQVITESQLAEEIRVTAFLNRQPDVEDRQTKQAASDRLIQQRLVRREMDLSQYPLPSPDQISNLIEETKKQFGGAKAFDRALAIYALSEQILSDHLSFQLMMLKFIDFRFRPDVEISDNDIRSYYDEELTKWRRSHATSPPSLEQSRASIEKTLSDQRVDYALSSWLEQARREASISFLDKELS